jgi:hypothetical protein
VRAARAPRECGWRGASPGTGCRRLDQHRRRENWPRCQGAPAPARCAPEEWGAATGDAAPSALLPAASATCEPAPHTCSHLGSLGAAGVLHAALLMPGVAPPPRRGLPQW